jgi:hypothetical protein
MYASFPIRRLFHSLVLGSFCLPVAAQTPLTITCPTNVTIATCAINGEQVFFNATTKGGCGGVTVTSTPPSGAIFPLGVTTVLCRAQDACTNTASCDFIVRVVAASNCVATASLTGGEPATVNGGVAVSRARLAELALNDQPLPAAFPEDEQNEIEDEVEPPVNVLSGPAPPGIPSVSQTPAPIVSWTGPGPLGGMPGDPQISASHTHIVVAGRAQMAFYTKAGTQLMSLSARSFFLPLGLDNGTVDAINIYTDIRTIFDAYRNRFWLVAFGWNNSQTNLSKQRMVVTLAVSQTEDPLGGWYEYWWDGAAHWGKANDVIYQAGDSADYPTIGIDPKLFHQTIGVRAVSGAIRYWYLRFFNADQMAAGLLPVQGWEFWDLTNPDGSTLTQVLQATVHHGNTSVSYYASRRENNKVVIWQLSNPFTPLQKLERVALTFSSWQSPLDAPQAGSTKKVKTTNLGTHVVKSVYRGGALHLVTNDARDWFEDGEVETSVRLIRLAVTVFPNIPTAGDPTYINWFLGKNGAGDSGTAHVYYYWPAVEVNSQKTMVTVCARSSSSLFPEMRANAFFDGDAVISPSRLIKAGEAACDIPICDSSGAITGPSTIDPIFWGDCAGASVDPMDDLGIWIVHQYATTNNSCNGNYQLWVAKLFGSLYADYHFKHFDISHGSFQPGTTMDVSGQLTNQGDGTTRTNRVEIYLTRSSASDLLLAQIPTPALRPGKDHSFKVSFTLPPGPTNCDSLLKALVNPGRGEVEYSLENNVILADLLPKLEITPVATHGPYRLRVLGKEGCSYTLQVSPDLGRWADLTTQTIGGGSYEFVDADVGLNQRFYRALAAF